MFRSNRLAKWALLAAAALVLPADGFAQRTGRRGPAVSETLIGPGTLEEESFIEQPPQVVALFGGRERLLGLSPRVQRQLPAEALAHYNNAVEALDRINYDLALKDLIAAAQAAPNVPDLHFMIVKLATYRGESSLYLEADEFYQIAIAHAEQILKLPKLTAQERSRAEYEREQLIKDREGLAQRYESRMSYGRKIAREYAKEIYPAGSESEQIKSFKEAVKAITAGQPVATQQTSAAAAAAALAASLPSSGAGAASTQPNPFGGGGTGGASTPAPEGGSAPAPGGASMESAPAPESATPAPEASAPAESAPAESAPAEVTPAESPASPSAGAGAALSPEASQALSELTAAAGAVQSMSADMEMSMTGPMAATGTGKMMSKGSLVKSTMDLSLGGMPIGFKMTSGADGIMWNETTMGQNVQVMKVDPQAMAAGAGGLGANPLANSPAGQSPEEAIRSLPESFPGLMLKGTETVGGVEVYVFEADMPKSPGGGGGGMDLSFDKATLKIAKADGVMRELLMSSANGVTMNLLMKNVQINPALDDAEFAYTPPPGVQVQDLSAMAGGAARPQPAPPAPAQP